MLFTDTKGFWCSEGLGLSNELRRHTVDGVSTTVWLDAALARCLVYVSATYPQQTKTACCPTLTGITSIFYGRIFAAAFCAAAAAAACINLLLEYVLIFRYSSVLLYSLFNLGLRSTSLAIARFIRPHITFYYWSVVTMSLSHVQRYIMQCPWNLVRDHSRS